jgi:rod shape determining protein RodA
VAILTAVGYFGVILASSINKKIIVFTVVGAVVALPLIWQVLAPYQKTRVQALLNPGQASYNSIQSMISVGSGKLTGRGLGRGVETQLSFLPEKQTDFIFASIAEEMGFVGAVLVAAISFFVLYRIISILERSRSVAARAFIAGTFLTLFVQVLVHIGMNMGLFPITGLPLPLVSAGGSSLVATMAALGMVVGARK